MAKKKTPIMEALEQDIVETPTIVQELPTLQEMNAKAKQTNKANEIIAILSKHNIDEQTPLYIDLVALFAKAKKAKTPTEEQPLFLYNDSNEITHKYCIWHKEYEPIDQFAKYNRSKDGYLYECKLASKHWMLYGKQIKEVEEAIDMAKNAVLDGVYTIERGKEVIAELKEELNKLQEDRKNKVDNPALVITEADEDTEYDQRSNRAI